MKPVDPAVRAYLSELGKRGGTASAAALGSAGRVARARKAIAARWAAHVAVTKSRRTPIK